MTKINVTICTGTTCYLMGASNLMQLDEILDPETMEKVEINGSHCLGVCTDAATGKAPYVVVDGEIIPEATLDKVAAKIKSILEN